MAQEVLATGTDRLQAAAQALLRCLEKGDCREAGASLLRVALSETRSECGLIGVVTEDQRTLRLVALEGVRSHATINKQCYDKAMQDYQERGYLECSKSENLLWRVLTSKEPIISNDPATDPRSGGVPPGYPPLRSFLGVPIPAPGRSDIAGMIGVANRAGGYSRDEQVKLEILARVIGLFYGNSSRPQHEVELPEGLRQAEKLVMLGTLTAGVAHELKNSLFIVTGYVQLIGEKLSRKHYKGIARDAGALQGAAERAAAVADRYLSLAFARSIRSQLCSVNDAVKESLQLVANDFSINRISSSTDLQPGIPQILADPQAIIEVLLNLLMNSRYAMLTAHGKGAVRIRTALVSSGTGQYAEIRVSDDGPGIPAELLPRIFDPFFTTKPPGQGTGLGLAICKRLVSELGGTLTCDSAAGRGTVFTLQIPAFPQGGVGQEAEAADRKGGQGQ